MDALVSHFEQGGVGALGGSWQTWLEGAAEQLETDDSFDAHVTDELAETLAEAEDAITSGYDCSPALRRGRAAAEAAEAAHVTSGAAGVARSAFLGRGLGAIGGAVRRP